jgi:cholesterol oxidase
MSEWYDAIVVGSGFGGAVVAARLAEHGARVLVLERGRRWTKDQYPRRFADAWRFSHVRPHKRNGWFDIRFFRQMVVVQGAGVGGSSLCYSGVAIEVADDVFDAHWPPEITGAELRPYYDRVARMLNVRPIPAGQQTARGLLLEHAAARLGYADRITRVPLAISFDDAWNYALPEPLDVRHSKERVNEQGQRQGTCVHLGNCDLGCDVGAKNSLDFNYIPLAERHGADVRPLHVVRSINPERGGYEVRFDRIEHRRLTPGSVHASKVVLAAGSLGSTELLLRCRDQYRSLPNVSPRLGRNWSPNGNALMTDRYPDGPNVRQGIGPAISAGLDFSDASVAGERFYLEDDGFPNLLRHLLRPSLHRSPDEWNPARRLMVLMGMGVDQSDGELRLGRPRLAPWRTSLDLRWRRDSARALTEAILSVRSALSNASGGRPVRTPFWRRFVDLMSVHPLGGCGMGGTAETGVVDHRGALFGYPNLFVADGAILPAAVGRNPSLTIGAVAERIADLMIKD